MTSQLDTLIEKGRLTETDRVCEHQLARVTGQPSLAQLLAHMTKFHDGDPRDVVACGLHLSTDDYQILQDAADRVTAAKKAARYK